MPVICRAGSDARNTTSAATSSGRAHVPERDARCSPRRRPLHRSALPLSARVRMSDSIRVGERGPRADVVHEDVVRPQLPRQRLRQADDGEPGRVGEDQAVERLLDGVGGDVDDPAAALLPQMRQRGANGADRAEEVLVQRRLPCLVGVLLEGAEGGPPALFTTMSSRPNRSDCRRHEALDVFRPRHVADTAQHVDARWPRGSPSAASSSGCSLRAQIATRQPSRARPIATALPMPRLAPPTSATLPSSPRSMIASLAEDHERCRIAACTTARAPAPRCVRAPLPAAARRRRPASARGSAATSSWKPRRTRSWKSRLSPPMASSASPLLAFAPQPGLHRHVEQNREVGSQAAGRQIAGPAHRFEVQSAPVALVGDRRVAIAVADDDGAARPARGGSPRRPVGRAPPGTGTAQRRERD